MIHHAVTKRCTTCNEASDALTNTFQKKRHLEMIKGMFYKLQKLRAATPLPYKGGERRHAINE